MTGQGRLSAPGAWEAVGFQRFVESTWRFRPRRRHHTSATPTSGYGVRCIWPACHRCGVPFTGFGLCRPRPGAAENTEPRRWSRPLRGQELRTYSP